MNADNLRIALQGLLANRLRSALTMLGILIGIAAVILTVGLGLGSQQDVSAQINALGSNLLIVTPGSSTTGGIRGGFGSATTLTRSDAEALASFRRAVDLLEGRTDLDATNLYNLASALSLSLALVGAKDGAPPPEDDEKLAPADKLPTVAFMKEMAELNPLARGQKAVPPREQQVMNAVSRMCMGCHDSENDPHFDLYKYWPKVAHGNGNMPVKPAAAGAANAGK